MRLLMIAIMSVVFAAPSKADEATRAAAGKAAEKMMEDAFLYLGVAYLCQKAVGVSHYHLARLAVEQSARIGGKSDTDAVILADDFDKRVKKDHPKLAKEESSAKCMDQILEQQTSLRVSQARFKKAVEADK